MSLIEQAARRLEELRRAGAELPDATAQVGAPRRSNGETPTPEALIKALEERAATVRVCRSSIRRGARRRRVPRDRDDATALRCTGRCATSSIDLARLRPRAS